MKLRILGLLAGLVFYWPGLAFAADPKPNVIFILADDLGYGELGCFGQKRIQTPHLDQLAREGMRFTQAYAGATVCAPSRCCLMTGKHGGHAFIRGNREIKPEGQEPMPADTFTVAHLMKQAGYATGLIGKWGLGKPDSDSTPDKMGFDYFYGYNCQTKAHEYYPEYLWRNNQKVMLNGQAYAHDLMAGEALEFVKRNCDKPFFLYLAFTIPHAKFQVPSEEPYAGEDWPAPQKRVAAMITRMDKDIGRLMALLRELKLEERTLVFFASDNGSGRAPGFFGSSGPLRGIKRDMYEGGLRSPSLARWPGKIKAGAVSEQPWAFWDFLPTAAELAGAMPLANIDGISVAPALTGRKQPQHEFLYWENHGRRFEQAVRMGNWKAIRQGLDGKIALYGLASDVGETTDLALENPGVVKRIEEILRTVRTEAPEYPTDSSRVRKGLS